MDMKIEAILRLLWALVVLKVMQEYKLYYTILITPLVICIVSMCLILQRPLWRLVLEDDMYEALVQYRIMDISLEIIWWFMTCSFCYFGLTNIFATFVAIRLSLIIYSYL